MGLKFNPRKVKLRVRQVTYVGHVFTFKALKPDQKKCEQFKTCHLHQTRAVCSDFLEQVTTLTNLLNKKLTCKDPSHN